GIVAGNAPDWAEFLVTPAPWAPRAGVAYLVYHRGVTHSLLGAAVLTAALARGASRRAAARVALGGGLRRRCGGEPPLPRLAGVLRPAAVPALERALVLRRLGGDRGPVFLGGAAHGPRLGRPAPLGAGPRVRDAVRGGGGARRGGGTGRRRVVGEARGG